MPSGTPKWIDEVGTCSLAVERPAWSTLGRNSGHQTLPSAMRWDSDHVERFVWGLPP